MVMGVVFAATLQAENVYSRTDRTWFNNTQFGKFKMGGGVGESNLYVGMDWMLPSKRGFSMGFALDYLNYDASNISEHTYGSVYTLGAEIKIGYDLGELSAGYLPVQLKAGYGYGVARIYTVNEWGANYSVAAEVNVYKALGIGVAHHWQDTDSITFDDTVVYLSLSY